MVDKIAAGAPGGTAAPVSAAYGRYALCLLLVVYVLNFLDRQVLSILAEPIKQELGLADWQIGVMSGLAFAIFYTVLGIPIARYAERANRPRIIAGCAVVWSAFTMLCGVAQNFLQLVAMRIGVGVGEAGCVPASMSLISDYVPKEKRSSAIAFYMSGAPLGSLLGMVIGGFVAASWGWRAAFLVVGAPGILAGLVCALTLVETRGKTTAPVAAAAPRETMMEVARILWRKPTYRLIVMAVAIKGFINYGLSAFMGSFFLRNHAADLAEAAAALGMKPLAFLGAALGLSLGLTGVLGAILGGWLGDRYGARDIRNQAAIPALAVFASTPLYIMSLMADSLWMSLGLLLLPAVLNALWYGPAYAVVQGLVAPQMRATTTAIMMFVVNLVGLGLGPMGIGIVSDLISKGLGMGDADGVRGSLIVFVLAGLVAGVLFWRARRTIAEDTVS